MEAAVEVVDAQGRIVLPMAWRKKFLKKDKVLVSVKGDTVEVKPLNSVDITEYFDRLEVDVQADFSDWHKVRREL